MMNLLLRDETPADIPAIAHVTIAAFKDVPVSRQTEHFILEHLRAANALTISIVAQLAGQIVGHIAFSPVMINQTDCGWFGLGPLSVLPSNQRQGIGKALMHRGLTQLRNHHAKGCCLVGHPAYYTKFGFHNTPDLFIHGVPPEVFFALPFDNHQPRGQVDFHRAFHATQPIGSPTTPPTP
jgi:putative acetyltransferase